MSLTAFHKVFISICLVFCLFLVGFGAKAYVATASVESLQLSIAGCVGFVALAIYARWFGKHVPKDAN